MLIGAALCVEILKPPSCLSLCLQDDHLNIVSGIKASAQIIKSIAEQNPLQWQTPNLVCSRVIDEGEEKVFQGAGIQWN